MSFLAPVDHPITALTIRAAGSSFLLLNLFIPFDLKALLQTLLSSEKKDSYPPAIKDRISKENLN